MMLANRPLQKRQNMRHPQAPLGMWTVPRHIFYVHWAKKDVGAYDL